MPTPKVTKLSDYTPYPFVVQQVILTIALDPEQTRIESELLLTPNPDYTGQDQSLILFGEHLELISLVLDGQTLSTEDYQLDHQRLIIPLAMKAPHQLNIVTDCKPRQNAQLSGLYESAKCLVTQCEAEGFRRMTFYPDRPDVMSRFRVTLAANKADYPILLANGNLVAQGDDEQGRHWAIWDDPFQKPCYLFALVAGNLACIRDTYRTQSNQLVNLAIYASHQDIDRCHYAMQALKASMQWDEKTYGCECDLADYTLVVVDDFNSGAMENKGLNIFNSKYILVNPDTATDIDYQHVLAVVGHEYFHNWSGNRVTCRDWFQLSLKEGFTIFREQQFMADQFSADGCRIEAVKRIRTEQFAQDASTMAHPVQPDEYLEIRNFYTVTTYEKGAEIIRMLERIVGYDGFIAGAKAYFKRFDGQAITIDEFVDVIAKTNGFDPRQFFRWYKQAGTPQVLVSETFDPINKTYALQVKQHCEPTPHQPEKYPFYIPMAVSFIDQTGHLLPVVCEQALPSSTETEAILPITEREQTFLFSSMPDKATISLFRGFSAPVRVKYDYTVEQLIHLAQYETDTIARWDAVQSLILRYFSKPDTLTCIITLFRQLLTKALIQPGLTAFMIQCLDERYVFEMCPNLSIDDLVERYDRLYLSLAECLEDGWLHAYQSLNNSDPYEPTPAAMERRAMKNHCLGYLALLPSYHGLVVEQYSVANNMTDRYAALKCLSHLPCDSREDALRVFYQRYRDNPLVIDMWYGVQARSTLPGTLSSLQQLMNDKAFNWRNPNRLYATVGAFTRQNLRRFHAIDGSGYRFLAQALVKVDAYNPEVAARLAEPFTRWQRLDTSRQAIVQQVIQDLRQAHHVSHEMAEILPVFS